jgi:RimJ/RimL family protein N-acetyltransferase
MELMDVDLELGDDLRLRWAHGQLAVPRIWLEIEPGNEPSLRLAQRAGYRFEQLIAQHCRDWACEDAERDSWPDCLIWVHASGGVS